MHFVHPIQKINEVFSVGRKSGEMLLLALACLQYVEFLGGELSEGEREIVEKYQAFLDEGQLTYDKSNQNTVIYECRQALQATFYGQDPAIQLRRACQLILNQTNYTTLCSSPTSTSEPEPAQQNPS